MTSHSREVRGPLTGRRPEEPPGVARSWSMRRRHVARDRPLPAAHPLQRAGQRVDVSVLGKKSGRAGPQRQQPEFVLAGTREHHHELVGQPPKA